jgi:site-specific DNA recombinase
VRYCFYVRSALLRGRKAEAGSIGRVPAAEIENAVLAALEENRKDQKSDNESDPTARVERVVVARNHLQIWIATGKADGDGTAQEIRIARPAKSTDAATVVEGNGGSGDAHNEV